MSDFDPQVGREVPVDPILTQQQADLQGDDVDAAVKGLAGLVADVEELDDVLTRIAHFALASIPGAEGVGVTLIHPGDDPTAVLAWAVTDPFVREIDHLQYDVCREGPCLTAMNTKRPLISGSVGSDARWPRFGGRLARQQVHSAMALPLVVRGTVVGALNVYAHVRDAFTENDLRLGRQFATPAAVTVHTVQTLRAARTYAAQLETALHSRAIIDQAIGILRSRSGDTAAEAFDRLRGISQAENVKVSVIAERMVAEAVRRAHARHSRA
jgi:GAF domain-containing protein